MNRIIAALSLAALPALGAPAAAQNAERIDWDAIYKIKDQGFAKSQVMDIVSWLTDVYGPRPTNSVNFRNAGEWAQKRLTEYGLSNVHFESWAGYGQGWYNERTWVNVLTPQPYTVIAYAGAFTSSTPGAVKGEAVLAIIQNEADLEKYRGKLRGKFVLTDAVRAVPARFAPLATRFTDAQLAEMQKQTPPPPRNAAAQVSQAGAPAGRSGAVTRDQRNAFFKEEGVLALVHQSGQGDGGTVWSAGSGSRNPNDPPAIPMVTLAVEHYGRIARTLQKNVPVTMEMDVRSKFTEVDANTFNIIGEIPGTDPRLKDEVVMIGGHFDSVNLGTGATDNAAGCAIMMEVMRILKASGLKNRRTIRIALWGGEEQGYLGSLAYVAKHFAEGGREKPLVKKDGYDKLSVYFNVDNGTGAIRGVYQQGNEAVAPIFRTWMEPFANIGMNTLTIRNTGGTDHQPFDYIGLPGFQFIQDEVEYDTRTHHSSMDVFERIQAEDMMKNAVIVASFVYHAANRDEKIPRKP